jgi:hypothetical protein
MNLPRIFQPQRPDEVKAFMESVQMTEPPIHTQIIDTAKQVARALGATAATVLSSPLALAEGALYAGANILAVPSVTLNKAGSIVNKTRTSVFNTIMGRR